MMNQARKPTLRQRTPYDGWIELWELIYGEAWPFRDRATVQWLEAYLDFRLAQ